MPHRLHARRAAHWCGLGLLLLLLAPFSASPAAGARSLQAASPTARTGATTLALAYQQLWVQSAAGLRFHLKVHSPLPASQLGLRVVLYSKLANRDSFEASLSGQEPASEVPIDSVPQGTAIPLADLQQGSRLVLHLPVATGSSPSGSAVSPTLSLDCQAISFCPGVYPLQLVLLNTENGTQLATLTTYLVYAPPSSGARKLRVGLVLPLGTSPALSPLGTSSLSESQLRVVAAIARRLAALAPGSLTVELHSQLLVALERTPHGAAHGIVPNLATALGGSAPRQQLLESSFAGLDPGALAADGLGAELGTQLRTGRTAAAASLGGGVSPPAAWVAHQPLDVAGLQLLESEGVNQLVLPASSLSNSSPNTAVSPYRLSSGGGRSAGGDLAFVSDPQLDQHFQQPSSDPVLSAEQFLAELAVLYFDEPYDTSERAVVVAPDDDGPDLSYLAAVLGGLASSPVLQPATLASLFQHWEPSAAGLPTARLARASTAGQGLGAAVASARQSLGALRSVVPTARSLLTRASQAILLGEGAGLSPGQRQQYEGAPEHQLLAVGRALTIGGSRAVTLTSHSGQIPVTVENALSTPVDVVLRVRSSDLTFPGGRTRFRLRVQHAALTSVPISAITSGATTLGVEITAPSSGRVLAAETISIHSTAISGVGIALSIGALLVLGVWWARSVARHRRKAGRHRRAQLVGSSAPPAA